MVKNASNFFSLIALLIFVVIANFSGLLNVNFPASVLIVTLFLAVILGALYNTKDGKMIVCKSLPTYFIPWVCFLLFLLPSYSSNTLGSTRIFCGILLCFLLSMRTSWISQVKYVFAIVTGINVFFTFFFFFFPSLYSYVIEAYGYTPAGTSSGTAGYRAGIADHYSQNGIYISIFILTIFALLLSQMYINRKDRRINLLICILVLAGVALLLTGKRGVLVFVIIAAVLTYMISSSHKMDRFFKLIIVALVIVGALQILSEFVPAIAYVFERFQVIGEDGSSRERLAMWELAIKKFRENPILGNGFWSFRAFYHSNLASIFHAYDSRFQYLNAHNVYLQVLCETGIIGEIVYVLAVVMMLSKTIRMARDIRTIDSTDFRFGILLSLGIQIFYCIYSFTGNCLYDIVFLYYAIAIAIVMAVDKYLTDDLAILKE